MNFTIKQLSILFVIVSLAFLWTLLALQTSEITNKKLRGEKAVLQKQIDSLGSENFTLELKLFRQQKAIEIFEKRNPEASSQLGDIISDETE